MISKNVSFVLMNLKVRKKIDTQCFKSFSNSSILKNLSESSTTPKTPIKWNLFASVCIERMPIITCDMNDLEKRYSNLINELNIRKSLLSDHELRHLKDLEIAEKRKASNEQQENREVVIETAQDYEDKCLKQLQSFTFADRKSSSKKTQETAHQQPSGVIKNIDRILDKKLLLILYNEKEKEWQFPKVEWAPNMDNSLRQTAERSVHNLNEKSVGLTVDFLGNAPAGVFKAKVKEGIAEKHYIFKAQYKSGGELLALAKYDYAWIRKEELPDFIKDEKYLACLNDIILDF